MIAIDAGPKLSLGEVILTPGAAAKLPPEDVTAALRRHARGDWGDISLEEKQLNDVRAEKAGPVASIFTSSNGTKFFVLTEPDRSVTTVLLPEEY